MRITIIQDDGLVGVDGVFRQVNLSELAGVIHAIQYDTEKGAGHIEYDRGATIEVDVRDTEAERAAEAAAGDDREALAALQPIVKKVAVPRENDRITDFTPYQVFVDRWRVAQPKRRSMRTTKVLAALAALAAMMLPPSPEAQELSNYVGVAVGRSDMRQACDGVAIPCTDTDTGWKLFAGLGHYYGFHVEFAYARLGEAEASGAGERATKRVSLIELSVLKDFPLFSRAGVYGKAGLIHYDVDISASAPVPNFAPKGQFSSGGFAPTIAAGARYNLSRTVALRAEWQRYLDAGEPADTGRTDVDFASVAVLYMF